MGHILYVDDDRALVTMITEKLGYSGHNVDPAFTLEEGMQKILNAADGIITYNGAILDWKIRNAAMDEVTSFPLITGLHQLKVQTLIFTGGNPYGGELGRLLQSIKETTTFVEKPDTSDEVLVWAKNPSMFRRL